MNKQSKTWFKSTLKHLNSVALLRTILLGLSILIQLFVIFIALWMFDTYFIYFYLISMVLGLCISLIIVNNKSNPAYKIAWIILILFVPIFGSMIYLLFGSGHTGRMERKLIRSQQQIQRSLDVDDAIIAEIAKTDKSCANQLQYLQFEHCPAYKGTSAEFLSPGEVKFERLKLELEKAEKFIFIEYFIIANGVMWEEILEILKRKVKQGVEVRVMYDDFGSLLTLPYRYGRYLKSLGIKHCVFNKLIPVLSALINHRDHRKIVVIDGKVGFTGGINIADEYINVKKKHGHWKDSSIVIEGEAVWSLTVMFLSTWDYINNIEEDFSVYKAEGYRIDGEENGYVQPYYDSPLDDDQVGENVYLNMISRAKNYVYIESPYLLIDREMEVALTTAAKQGVDVRIITPHIGDHWYVHAMTRSNYEILTHSGVKIYEYTPGFIHAKVFVCDDELATVGTINMDYRSLYLHFECGVLLYKSPAIQQIYDDFLEIVKCSEGITYEACRATPWHKRIGRGLLKVFAPLM